MRPGVAATPPDLCQVRASSYETNIPESVQAKIASPNAPNALMRELPGNPLSERDHDRPRSVVLNIAWMPDCSAAGAPTDNDATRSSLMALARFSVGAME